MSKHFKPETRKPRPETAWRDSRGATLIEVMCAAGIFLLGMIALLGMSTYALNFNKSAREVTIATDLTSDMTERLFSQNLNNAALTLGTHSDPNNPINEKGDAGGKFTRTWTVAQDASTNTRLVTVTVSWTDWIGKNRHVQWVNHL